VIATAGQQPSGGALAPAGWSDVDAPPGWVGRLCILRNKPLREAGMNAIAVSVVRHTRSYERMVRFYVGGCT
jgi:hypothetical protein